ncbi:hypothetical protein CHS0354_025767 [Potamilus streckersoni]|uniref:Uncharacterized protein n=1 Tax=Potamilus streckersoni TaxID=2493646 RepID=A0AAE0RUD5_9BIVA|nr:hypothetical protein CHS0354_025767 [Potamilus streckersoni]
MYSIKMTCQIVRVLLRAFIFQWQPSNREDVFPAARRRNNETKESQQRTNGTKGTKEAHKKKIRNLNSAKQEARIKPMGYNNIEEKECTPLLHNNGNVKDSYFQLEWQPSKREVFPATCRRNNETKESQQRTTGTKGTKGAHNKKERNLNSAKQEARRKPMDYNNIEEKECTPLLHNNGNV